MNIVGLLFGFVLQAANPAVQAAEARASEAAAAWGRCTFAAIGEIDRTGDAPAAGVVQAAQARCIAEERAVDAAWLAFLRASNLDPDAADIIQMARDGKARMRQDLERYVEQTRAQRRAR